MSNKLLIAVVLLAIAIVTHGTTATIAAIASHQADPQQAGSQDVRPVPQVPNPEASGVEQPGEQVTEEFHQTYPLSATGRVSLGNLNGGVKIKVWDRAAVQVDAVKKAYRRERLAEAQIEVTSTEENIRIKTEYPDRNQTFRGGEGRYDNPATVEYALTVPRTAMLDSIDLVNGELEIDGVEAMGGAEHTIIPDRIETGTFIVAAAITGGEVEIRKCDPEHLRDVIEKLGEAGVEIEELNQSTLSVKQSPSGLTARSVTTEPHPLFPTDMQAQYMALMTQAEGDSVIKETIFENRFMHASELMRMGARISIAGNEATVHGKTPLTGARILASDLRASASLVLAALCARGETLIDRVYHIDRGYESIVKKLGSLGADIERITDSTASVAEAG